MGTDAAAATTTTTTRETEEVTHQQRLEAATESSLGDYAEAAVVDVDDEDEAALLKEEAVDVYPYKNHHSEHNINIYADDDDLNLPPGRMNATRVPQRLCSSTSSLHIPPQLNSILSRRLARDGSGGGTPRSRSRSPSMKEKGTTTTRDTDSSISSLEDLVDQDILYDRQGFSELDNAEVQRKMHNSREFTNLPPVSERMSEETLDDVHAFTDLPVVRSSNASTRGGSLVSGGDAAGLEPLSECENEDDLDDLDDVMSDPEVPPDQPAIIVTNMENLTLSQERDSDGARVARVTGESSLLEEAPSAPTA